MIEVDSTCGDTIDRVCEALATKAPAFCADFNGVRLESKPGDTAADLTMRYRLEMGRRRAEAESRQRAFDATPEGQAKLAEARRARALEATVRAEALASVERSGVRTKYPWTETMREISGFGGGYEDACRDMLYAGLAWVDARPGPIDMDALKAVILAICPDCSGAMFGAARNAVMYVHANGWAKYAEAMRAQP